MSIDVVDQGDSAGLLSEADAWTEYLTETQEIDGARYREVEPWAWVRLKNRLSYIRRRDRLARKKPRPKPKGPYGG